MTQPILLSAAGLTLGFRDVAVVEDVTFELARGDVLAVVGHNGAGKSTLIRTLLGGLPPLAGVLNWPLGRPQNIAYLGQRTEFDNRFPIRVRDLAAMGAWSGLGFSQKIDGECRARIEVGIRKYRHGGDRRHAAAQIVRRATATRTVRAHHGPRCAIDPSG